MERTQLRFENIQQVVGSEELAVIQLTDLARQRSLSVICDEQMTKQIMSRVEASPHTPSLLPEALVQLLDAEYEMMVYGVHDGQYQVVLSDTDFNRSVRIRMSDAVLLNLIAHYPLYIEEQLMKRQSVPFEKEARGVTIPINTLDSVRLNTALQHAIDDENYELASQLRDELNRRKTLKK